MPGLGQERSQSLLCERVKAKQWSKQEFFPDKFEQFNGCEIVVEPCFPTEPAIGLDTSTRFGNNMSYGSLWGYAIDFNIELAYYLNFSTRFNAFYRVLGRSVDASLISEFIIFCHSQRQMYAIQDTSLWATGYFTTSDTLIITSRFRPYTQFEKFIMPYEAEVWHWLFASLVITVVVVFGLKLTPIKIQRFVIGSRVKSPMLNFM